MSFDEKGSVLRAVAALVLLLCGLAVVVGFIPGVDVYEDKNDCIGHALARAFSWHAGSDDTPCVRDDVLLRTEAAGGWPLVVALLPVALGALALRRWPRMWLAAVYPLVMIGGVAIFLAFTFDLDLFSTIREVPRWPAILLGYIVDALVITLLVLFVATPIVAIMRYQAARKAAQSDPRLAQARVVKMGD